MVVSKHRVILVLGFCVYVVAIPGNYVVFISLAELMKRVNLVLNDLLSRARVQKFDPSLIDHLRVLHWSFKEAVVNRVWLVVNVDN